MDVAGDGGMGTGGMSARARHKTGLRRDTTKDQSEYTTARTTGYLLARFTGEETEWGACVAAKKREQGKVRPSRRLTQVGRRRVAG